MAEVFRANPEVEYNKHPQFGLVCLVRVGTRKTLILLPAAHGGQVLHRLGIHQPAMAAAVASE
jgi:hypothetical protein